MKNLIRLAAFLALSAAPAMSQQSTPAQPEAAKARLRLRRTSRHAETNRFGHRAPARLAATCPLPGCQRQTPASLQRRIARCCLWVTPSPTPGPTPNLAVSFPAKPYVDRGISGQTTPQMLIRFRPDVIALQPQAVVILAGTNDIAGNTGPMTLEQIEANLASMTELAPLRTGIRVILASVLPVSDALTREGKPIVSDCSPPSRKNPRPQRVDQEVRR